MRAVRFLIFSAFLALTTVNLPGSAEQNGTVDSAASLQRLAEGNARFAAGRTSQLAGGKLTDLRSHLTNSQKPFAVILSCSDSRVPPELVFDQTLGDLFVVRVAGEIPDPVDLASIEYAVEHLGSSLVVVMGHQRCGAVSAALAGGEEPGHIAALLKLIQPAVEAVKGKPGDPLDNAVRAQIDMVVRQIQSDSELLAARVRAGKVAVAGAYYNLDSGKVEFVKPAK